MQESVTYLPVTVYIDDINDHRPVFTSAPYNITVLESATPGMYGNQLGGAIKGLAVWRNLA